MGKVKKFITTVLVRDWGKDTIASVTGGNIHEYNIYGKPFIHQNIESKRQKGANGKNFQSLNNLSNTVNKIVLDYNLK